MRRIEGGIMLPDGPGDRPMRCECCVIPRQMVRRLNGPRSIILYCPSSKNGLILKNVAQEHEAERWILRPMWGLYSGDDTAGNSRRIYGRRDERPQLVIAS